MALARRVRDYLDEIGHTGPRVLIHSCLGRIEWEQSLPVCQKLAERLGMELIVTRRAAGDLIHKFESRWAGNVRRYLELESVRLILPWPTAQMRFCTSEAKCAPIAQALTDRFPGQVIISCTGIRHQESAQRAKAPIAEENSDLYRVKKATSGFTWNPIIGWTEEEVYSYIAHHGDPLHEAYSVYGSTRLSCAFCILASLNDLLAASRCEYNAASYRLLVDLEARSTFAYQGARWLADVVPHLLSQEDRERIERAKSGAAIRVAAEARLPKHMMYSKGWPTGIPTYEEAALLGEVRQIVGHAVGIEVTKYLDADDILARYAELIELRETKLAKKTRKGIQTNIIIPPSQTYDCPELALF